MRSLFLIGFFFLSTTIGLAQAIETRRAQAGEDISKFISENGAYRFPAFAAGTYMLKDGSVSPATLNYNILIGEMQYITRRDTMSISNPQDFNFFKVNNVSFYFRDGYKEVIQDYDSYKLAVAIEISLAAEKVAAYGSPAGASKVSALSHFDGNITYQLKPRENTVVTKKITYYILDKDKLSEPATKKNFLKIFSKVPVAEYLKANSINFNKVEDLKKLLEFCAKPAG
jgi:hypothetical protein